MGWTGRGVDGRGGAVRGVSWRDGEGRPGTGLASGDLSLVISPQGNGDMLCRRVQSRTRGAANLCDATTAWPRGRAGKSRAEQGAQQRVSTSHSARLRVESEPCSLIPFSLALACPTAGYGPIFSASWNWRGAPGHP